MSQRHRIQESVPPPRIELRAHAHNERHRINSELHLVKEAILHGLEPLDIEEPGTGWKGMHHHDAERGLQKSRRKPLKHWKTKAWKRRTAQRREKAAAWRDIAA